MRKTRRSKGEGEAWGTNMHIQSAIKKRCAQCKIVKRRGKLYITCTNPKHKQRQG